MLWLLERTCVVTPLPTNNTRIGGVGKNETKQGVMYLGASLKALSFFFFFLFSFSFSFVHINIGEGGRRLLKLLSKQKTKISAMLPAMAVE